MQVADHRMERQTRDVGSEQGKIWKNLSVSRSLSSFLVQQGFRNFLSYLRTVHECSSHGGCESSIDRVCNSESASNASPTEASTVCVCVQM